MANAEYGNYVLISFEEADRSRAVLIKKILNQSYKIRCCLRSADDKNKYLLDRICQKTNEISSAVYYILNALEAVEECTLFVQIMPYKDKNNAGYNNSVSRMRFASRYNKFIFGIYCDRFSEMSLFSSSCCVKEWFYSSDVNDACVKLSSHYMNIVTNADSDKKNNTSKFPSITRLSEEIKKLEKKWHPDAPSSLVGISADQTAPSSPPPENKVKEFDDIRDVDYPYIYISRYVHNANAAWFIMNNLIKEHNIACCRQYDERYLLNSMYENGKVSEVGNMQTERVAAIENCSLFVQIRYGNSCFDEKTLNELRSDLEIARRSNKNILILGNKDEIVVSDFPGCEFLLKFWDDALDSEYIAKK